VLFIRPIQPPNDATSDLFLSMDFINLSLKKPALSEIAYECIQQTYDQIEDLGVMGACSFIAMLGRVFYCHLPMPRAG
jgi:hypothetical protein